MAGASSTQTEGLPLTPLQESMYLSASHRGQPWLYVEQILVRLPREALEPDSLARAWQALSAAEPALRRVIVEAAVRAPRQVLLPPGPVPVAALDWREMDASAQEAALAALLREDRARGVAATESPPFRVTLVQTGESGSLMLWTFPHSLLDGRSFAPLLGRLFEFYAEVAAGKTPRPAPETDLFAAHCARLGTLSHAAGLAHFAEALSGWEGSSGLIEAVEPTRKQEAEVRLPPDVANRLESVATRAGVSDGQLVTAAWGLILARLSGRGEVVLGATRAGRHLVPGTEAAAGCFITTVPLRLTLDRQTRLGPFLQQVRDGLRAARPHEHTPLAQVARRLGLAQGQPLLDSIVMFESGSLAARCRALGGAWQDREVRLFEEGEAPLSLAAYRDEDLKLVVEHDPAQVPRGPQMAAALGHLLRAMAEAGPDTPLGALSMLSPTEEARLFTLAGPETAPPTETCLSRFAHQVAARPKALALVTPEGESLSYAELDAAAEEVAAGLAAKGIGPGDRVGLCLPRSAAFVLSLIACWKRGAAFVPMDPSYPPAHLALIAEDSDASLILTEGDGPELPGPCLAFSDLKGGPVPPAPVLTPETIAYVIFTSGSTGRPKGVMVSHGALASHAEGIIPAYGLAPGKRALQFAALSFDVAIEEIVPTLLSGATLVLRSAEMAQSYDTFLTQSAAFEVTHLNLPTGFWVGLTDHLAGRPGAFPRSVELVVVGGERVPRATLERWRGLFPDLPWLNGYGPTEATITCTLHSPGVESGEGVPIGRPFGPTRAWVLGPDGALLPEGAAGELHLSGPALAAGYLGLPEETARRFTAPSFPGGPQRLYATGDRVRWQNGALEFLGRIDRQIKLRGFRIEPGQIEALLEREAGIGRAHVGLLPGGGALRLVAWYGARGAQAPPPKATIAALLAEHLPPQMQALPLPVESWPETAGGKTDVARLPRPVQEPNKAPTGPEDPRLPQVVEAFQTVLGLETMDPDISFFEAGGDSLSLLRLVPLLEQTLGQPVNPQALYADASPRGLLRALAAEIDPLVVVPIQPGGALPPLYAVHVIGDNGSFFRPLAEALGPEQPLFGLTVGLLSESTPTEVPDLAAFYLSQITRHHPQGPLALVAVSAGSYAALELAQQLRAAGREVTALILLDAEGPGGRARISRLAKLPVHLRLLAQKGLPYLAGLWRSRQDGRAVAREMAHLKGPAAEGAAENITRFIAANALAIEAYAPAPYAGRLTIFRAADDLFDSPEVQENGLGWAEVAAGGFDLIDVPGDHLGILEPPNVAHLAGHITALLAKACR